MRAGFFGKDLYPSEWDSRMWARVAAKVVDATVEIQRVKVKMKMCPV